MVLLGTVHWKVICVEVSSHEIKIIYSSLCLLLIQYKPVWVTWVNTIFLFKFFFGGGGGGELSILSLYTFTGLSIDTSYN